MDYIVLHADAFILLGIAAIIFISTQAFSK